MEPIVSLSPPTKSWYSILLSFLAIFVLMFLQLPNIASNVCLLLAIVVLMYWTIVAPTQVNVGCAWLLGTFLDIIYSAPFGENSLALVLLIYLIAKFRKKIITLDYWQIPVVIFVATFLYQLLRFLLYKYFGGYFGYWGVFEGALVGSLLWVPVAFLFSHLQFKRHA